jgi:hypothetical protein
LRAILDRLAASPDLIAHYQQRAIALRGKFLWSNEKEKYIAVLKRFIDQGSQAPARSSRGLQ